MFLTLSFLMSLYYFFFFPNPLSSLFYIISLHDALPILWLTYKRKNITMKLPIKFRRKKNCNRKMKQSRSEEHTSELQSRGHLVCRLLLEKKKLKLREQLLILNYLKMLKFHNGRKA